MLAISFVLNPETKPVDNHQCIRLASALCSQTLFLWLFQRFCNCRERAVRIPMCSLSLSPFFSPFPLVCSVEIQPGIRANYRCHLLSAWREGEKERRAREPRLQLCPLLEYITRHIKKKEKRTDWPQITDAIGGRNERDYKNAAYTRCVCVVAHWGSIVMYCFIQNKDKCAALCHITREQPESIS